MDKKDLGEKIRALMNEKSISSVELAKEVGITTVSVSNILTGKSSPSIDNLEKIAKALNVKPSCFFNEESDEEMDKLIHFACPHCGKSISFMIEADNKED